MAKGQKRTVQERLEDITAKRAGRKKRFDELDAIDAAVERELRKDIVRAEVTARHLAELENEVEAELAKIDAPEDGRPILSNDEVDEVGHQQFANV